MLTALYFILGLGLLYYGADYLVKGGASIALKLKVSPLVIGLTLVAYGTSAPELVVSVDASLKGLGDVSIGNVVGSNICNIALILGLCAAITPLRVNPELLKKDIWIMIGSCAILLGFFALNGGVNRWEAVLLLTGSLTYTLWSFHSSRKAEKTTPVEEMPETRYSVWFSLLMVMGGLAALVGGAKLFVNAAIVIAHSCGVSEAVIGLTVVAVGTSLPELATSVVAAVKKEQDIAIGNVVGSNIFNILCIMGISPMIKPISAKGISLIDFGVMIGIAVLLWGMMIWGKKINRTAGVVFLIVNFAYVGWLISRSIN